MEEVKSLIEGTFVEGLGASYSIISPATNEVIATMKACTQAQVETAIVAAKNASHAWRQLTIKQRSHYMFELINQLKQHKDELAQLISLENGKLLEESQACVEKAIELCEFSLMLPGVAVGRVEEVSKGIEAKEVIEGVGVVASITPFNFPLMVPMWTLPTALTLGNAFILKPSESTPLTALKLAELVHNTGMPKGLFTIVNGGKEVVETICTHPDVDVVTFVGSTPIAKIVYQTATQQLKRCLALGGAKNHIIVDQGVDVDSTVKELLAAAYGMSGQRCMAASVILLVGEQPALLDKLVAEAKMKKCGLNLPPLINEAAVDKIKVFLNETKGHILLNGFDQIDGSLKGHYVGGSIVLYEHADQMVEHEVFGPTLEIIQVNSIQEALEIQNRSPYANGASIFSDSGVATSEAIKQFTSGMIGINIGVPVPRDPFSFGGLKMSKFGYGDITGFGSIGLMTNTKKITTKWRASDRKDWMS